MTPRGTDASVLLELASRGRLVDFGEEVAELLGDGRLAAAAGPLVAEERPPLAVQILVADLRTRAQDIALHELADLDRQAREAAEGPAPPPGSDDLARWTAAVLAEWGLWKGDLSTIGYGRGELPGAAPPSSRLGRISEARRRRIDALAELVTDPISPTGEAARTGVRRTFDETGCVEELAITDIVFAYGRLGITDDLSLEPMVALRGGVERLDQLGADRLPFGLALLAWSAYMIGDFAGAADALDRFDDLPDASPRPPIVTEGVEMLRGLAHLAVEGPDPVVVDHIDRHFERMRRHSVPAWFVGPVANDLLDVGNTELATKVVDAVGSLVSFIRPAHQAIREVDARVRILAHGDRSPIDDLWNLYGEWEADGRWRRAASSALRCSWTARQAGMEAEADRLHRWGAQRLPRAEERTRWETIWFEGLLAGHPTPTQESRVQVLRPDLVVRRGDTEIHLGEVQAKLLALLVAVRRPVTIDWAMDALWPGVDPQTGRNRLGAVLHRLRQRIGLLPDELIRRRRTGLEIDGTGWDIDCWRFWDLSAGSVEAQLEAVELYRSDLVARQLAYDDEIAVERDRLRRRWSETIQQVVEAGALSPEQATARAHRLGLDPHPIG